MRKIIFSFLLLIVSGCATVNVAMYQLRTWSQYQLRTWSQ